MFCDRRCRVSIVRACVICVRHDALLVAVGVAGMAQLLGSSPTLAHYLTLGGALFVTGRPVAWHRAFFAADK